MTTRRTCSADTCGRRRVEAKTLCSLASRYQRHPSLEEVARVAGMSPYHFQRTFRAWTGVTPKRFIQYLQLGKAKDLLIEEQSLMTTALDVGLSGTLARPPLICLRRVATE
jgi:AraC family transcriptional regulator of adaptative response/methylated-DNA-[protein]-cysteine methyltransferase